MEADPKPSSGELDLDREPLTRTVARPVKARVRHGQVPLLSDAEAVAWTKTRCGQVANVRGRAPNLGMGVHDHTLTRDSRDSRDSPRE